LRRTFVLMALFFGALMMLGGMTSADVRSPASGGWPMQRGDIYGRAQSPYDASSNPGNTTWIFDTYGTPQGAPVIGPDGTIYISTDLCLQAIKDGKEIWRYMLTNDTSKPIHSSTPAIADDGSVYVGSDQGRGLYCLKNGDLNWSFDYQYPWFPSPILIAPDGSIYFGASSQMTALTPSGDLKWKATASYDITARPVMYGNTVYFVSRNSAGNVNATLYAMDASSGKMLWKWNGAYDIVSTLAISQNGTVYFAAIRSYMADGAFLYGVQNNKTILKINIGDFTMSDTVIDSYGNIYIGSTYPYENGNRAKVSSFYPNGTLRWSVDVKGSPERMVLDSAGNLYFTYNDYGIRLAAMDGDGNIRWAIGVPSDLAFEPAIGPDGTIYVTTMNNILLAIGETSDSGDGGSDTGDTGTGEDTGEDTGGDDSADSSDESSTPGFEALPAVMSIGLALLIYRRKRL